MKVTKKNWSEFRDSGLLWFININLHIFGWAIVIDLDNNGEISNAYPARINSRGFSEECNTKNYKKLTNYISRNIDDLKKDIE